MNLTAWRLSVTLNVGVRRGVGMVDSGVLERMGAGEIGLISRQLASEVWL